MTVRLDLVQIGKGTVGSALIEQIRAQRPALRDRLGVDLTYVGIAGRSGAALDPKGIDLERWRERIAAPGMEMSRLVTQALAAGSGNSVLIDATAEEGMPALYVEALNLGANVVSCNKKPLAGPLAEVRRVREAARRNRCSWLYEVTVGAGLPVINTLRDLLDTGDRLQSIEGCFSGTLNYLCAGLDAGEKFSGVLARARELGYTEPDPRDDLGGTDVARKALILAREAGLEIEPDAVRCEPFLPIDRRGDAAAYVAKAGASDGELARRFAVAKERGRRLRYVASIDTGCATGLREVGADTALGRLAGPENIFAFRTARYADNPLVVSGPGAGPEVTAAGAFADILRVARAVTRAA